MKAYKDIAYNAYCTLDMYLPDQEGFSTFVYFHGGGMVGGCKEDPRVLKLMESMVKHGFGFVSVEYRKYTEDKQTSVRFPEYLHDAADAVAYVKNNVKAHGGNDTLYVTGSSAGAWMTLLLCLDATYLSEVGIQNEEIAGWVIDSAQTTSHFNVSKFEKGSDVRAERIDEFAPLYYLNENSRFSKMLLLFYERDMTCRLEQNLLFHRSVLRWNPKADIAYQKLPGGHCAGIHTEGENGELTYMQAVLDWLDRKEER
jgi:alpha/beta superfamily hydrolase